QVSLQEWLRGGRRLIDFRVHDVNGDGFITPDEILRKSHRVHRLEFTRGQAHYHGAIEEATDERYQEKQTFKVFAVPMEEGKTYQIEHVSQAFYAFLFLENPSGEIIEKNNSGGRGLTSRIVHRAEESGIYRVIATSQDGIRTGEFALSIRVFPDVGGMLPRG